MNNHMGPGANQPPSYPPMPMHPHQHQHQSRRQQEYHAYQQMQPHSPMHPPPYAQWNQQYYGYPAPLPYQQQQWRPHNPYMPQYMPQQPPPPMGYPPRSPMVVSSQTNGPVTRHTPMPLPAQQVAPSPRPIPQHLQHPPHTPAAPPSPAPTPKQEQEPREQEEQEQEQRREEQQEQAPVSSEIADQQVKTPSAPQSRRQSAAPQNPLSLSPETKTPYYPKLPWYSIPAQSFPKRETARKSRRQHTTKSKNSDMVALPTREGTAEPESQSEEPTAGQELASEASTIAAPSEPETPATSQAPSESEYNTQASTPATPAQSSLEDAKITPTQTHARRDTKSAIAVPNIGAATKPRATPPTQSAEDIVTPTPTDQAMGEKTEEQSLEEPAVPQSPPKPGPPKSWADMFRTKAAPGAITNNGSVTTNGTAVPKSASLAEALKQYNVERDVKLAFIEPRGLKNMGLTCYMNSILQVLIYCTPFYSFLDLIRQRTVQNMKSETPLIDAMIMLINEFKVLASADSVLALRKQLKHQQLEQFGDQIVPKFFYDTLRQLPRFRNMKLIGEQQDAEEFLGFLLEGLHNECASVILSEGGDKPENDAAMSDAGVDQDDGWMEVQKKQKAAVTRTAGHSEAPTPITRIFGGYLRSEIRAPGSKDSVTRELFERLQLDIGATHVTNIVEALKGITRLEPISDFGRPGVTAKKQVFVDSLPPVLMLHLKRFEYDSSVGRTQKIWKKVGYPLDLEVPKEVFPPSKRGGFAAKGGLPKYRLIGVVYHHGKTAAGGHYTVDVRRQDGEEWIRIDDTIIRRIRKDDVAEGGSEEDPKILAQALEQHKADQDMQRQRNMYQGLDEADKEPEAEGAWSQVNGNISGHKKNYSTAATTNGSSTPRTPTAKAGVKDDKVAYILMYEKV